MKKKLEYAFTLSLLLAIAWGLHAGRGWNATTALFPRAVGFPMLLLLIGILGVGVVRERGRSRDRDRHREDGDPDSSFRATAARMARYFGWLLGFVVAIWAIGISLSIPIYVSAYMRVEGKYAWPRCLAYAAATAGLITIVYGYLFRVAWPEGALLRSLGL
jgi:cytochrome c oxidase subunit IV